MFLKLLLKLNWAYRNFRSNKSGTRELETAHSAVTELKPVGVTNWAFMQIGRALTYTPLTMANFVPCGHTLSHVGNGSGCNVVLFKFIFLCSQFNYVLFPQTIQVTIFLYLTIRILKGAVKFVITFLYPFLIFAISTCQFNELSRTTSLKISNYFSR